MLRNALSTSDLSLVVFSLCVPLAVFVWTVLVNWRKPWSGNGLVLALRASVKPVVITTGVTLLAWASLFSWAIYRSVYNDHQNLVGRLRTVVSEKDALKVGLTERDKYIKRLEDSKCPQCKSGGLSGPVEVAPVEEKISSITVEVRMTCTIKPDVELPPSTEEIMAGFGTGSLVGAGGTIELARTNPVEFRKLRGNEMVVVNHFYLPNSESLVGSPVSTILNFDKLVAPITVLGSGPLFDRAKLIEVTVTINNKHTWYYPYKIGDVSLQNGSLTVTVPLAGINKVIR